MFSGTGFFGGTFSMEVVFFAYCFLLWILEWIFYSLLTTLVFFLKQNLSCVAMVKTCIACYLFSFIAVLVMLAISIVTKESRRQKIKEVDVEHEVTKHLFFFLF